MTRPPPKPKDEKPVLIFRICKAQCFACDQCGYFWSDGQPAVFGHAGH